MSYVDETGEHILLSNPLKGVNGLWIKYTVNDSNIIVKSCDYWEISDTHASFTKVAGERMRFRKIFLEYNSSKKLPLSLNISIYFPKSSFFVIDYTLTNASTDSALTDLSLYWLIDLDIGGKESYDDDYAHYRENVIYQYHEDGVHSGFTSTISPSRYECNSPYAIRIKLPYHPDLTNIDSRGPADCAIGLQWDYDHLKPQNSINLPLTFAAGTPKTFSSNLERGVALLKQIKNADDPSS